MIFDSEKYRYQRFISDLNGVDIKAHENTPAIAIRKVWDWLQAEFPTMVFPGHLTITSDYRIFIHYCSKNVSAKAQLTLISSLLCNGPTLHPIKIVLLADNIMLLLYQRQLFLLHLRKKINVIPTFYFKLY